MLVVNNTVNQVVRQRMASRKYTLRRIQPMKKQQGFTLLEVMIASFVLAVGMLGSTAMMMRGLQQADNTNLEGVAVQAAMNMAERMRGNVAGQGSSGAVYDNLQADDSIPVSCIATEGCSSADVASYHAYIWGKELADLLPNANAKGEVISLTPGTDDAVYQITVEWSSDKRVDTTTRSNVVNTYVMIFQP